MNGEATGLGRVADELNSWLEALRIALAAERASLWMRANQGTELSAVLCRPEGSEPPETEVLLQGHALGWVVSEGVSLKASRREIFRQAPEGWVVAAPLSDRSGERLGCVALEFAGVPRRDAARAVELGGSVASRLLSGAQATDEATRDLAKYEALYGTIQDLDRKLDLEELAAGICRRARSVSGARAALVASWEHARRRGSVISMDGDLPRSLAKAKLEGDSSYLGLALINATILPRDDLTVRPKFPLYVEGVDSGAGSAIIVPMIMGPDPIGALAVEYGRPREYREGDLERLKALALFVAPAFRNALEFGEVRALSVTDALTGLPNRRATERGLALTAVVAERTGGAFAVAMADVDRFKQLNDRYGHEAGDVVLQTVARLIREGLRPGDIAGRWGGEEFLMVLPGANAEDAARVIDRIRRRIGQASIAWEGRSISVTISAGVTAFPERIRNAAAAVASADAALYRAKRSGRNAVAVSDLRG
ncbi:MAG: sensor domain-containing diguanylate cyclase [Gemmatimonadota bacterium]|nr:MAG: sensor domain-containing diguanylate cyclase [Gemmatimonadota bacterium]